MPFAAILPAIGVLVGDALSATGAIVNCYALHNCGGSDSRIRGLPDSVKMNFGRQATGPCGVPQYNIDLCQQQLQGIVVQTSNPASGVAQFDNVPPACMDLSTVLVGDCDGSGPTVIPCGSACLSYSGLTTDQLNQLSQALAPYASSS